MGREKNVDFFKKCCCLAVVWNIANIVFCEKTKRS